MSISLALQVEYNRHEARLGDSLETTPVASTKVHEHLSTSLRPDCL